MPFLVLLLVCGGQALAQDEPDRSNRILKLAKSHFGSELTRSDVRFFRAIANGETVYSWDLDEQFEEQAKSELASDRIEWLCTSPDAIAHVPRQTGIRLDGIRIVGRLQLGYIEIGFPLSIVDSELPHGVDLQQASIPKLTMSGSHVGGADGMSLFAEGIRVDGHLTLDDGFRANGEVRLHGATIGGSLQCSGGQFENSPESALVADGIQVRGAVFLKSRFKGMVSFRGATIGESFVSSGGTFATPGGIAISADRMEVNGDIRLDRGFTAHGAVRFRSAVVGGDVVCEGGEFRNPQDDAISATGSEVGGTVYFQDGFVAEGGVYFSASTINGEFRWLEARDPKLCTVLDLEDATVDRLWDQEASWPRIVNLDGFTYSRLDARSPLSSGPRVRWLQLNHDTQFLPQPYEQLARVLSEMGHDRSARDVLIAKETSDRRVSALPFTQRLIHRFLGMTIGYGYIPGRAVIWMVLFLIAGAHVFGWTFARDGYDSPDGPRPHFNAVVYSFDTFVPLIDMRQAKYRHPKHPGVRVYLWVHTLVGWVLTTLLVVGLTGLVR